MVNRRIPDLSPLWANDPPNRTIIRFHDISEQQKQKLVQAIKRCSPIWSIQTKPYVTPEAIYTTLMQINPVIFAQGIADTNRYARHREFAIYAAYTLTSWAFRQLCKAIYLNLCRKKPITPNQLTSIASLTYPDYTRAHRFVEGLTRTIDAQQEQPLPSTEVGLEDIEQARIRAERAQNAEEQEQEDRTYQPGVHARTYYQLAVDELANATITTDPFITQETIETRLRPLDIGTN